MTALARGLDILRCFDRPRVELSVSEIARLVGLSQATTWRLCATLIERGFLVRSATGAALAIGAPALTLGYAAINGMDLPAIALPYMRRLSERTGGSVTLSIRRGIEMVSVEQYDGDFVLPNQPVGWRAALSSSPSGLAVLAALDPGDRADTMAVLEARDPSAWPRRRERIEQAAADYAAHGVVTLADMVDGQYAAAAIPLVEGSGAARRHWAVSCGRLQSRWTAEALASARIELEALSGLLRPALATLRAGDAAA